MMISFLRKFAPVVKGILFAPPALLFCAGAVAASKSELPDPPAPTANSSGPETAGDLQEQIIAERLQLSLVDGEILWIQSEKDSFLAILRDSYEAIPYGCIIINIPAGGIVDSHLLYRTLAKAAAVAGWVALSIQPSSVGSDPVANPEMSSASARLDAAFDYVVSKGIENIVVVGEANGAEDAMNYIVQKASPAISGFVGIGEWDAILNEANIPILDIAGTRDHGALTLQNVRAEKYRRREKPIEKLQIDGAGPGFYGYEDQIAKRIRGLIKRTTPGVALKR